MTGALVYLVGGPRAKETVPVDLTWSYLRLMVPQPCPRLIEDLSLMSNTVETCEYKRRFNLPTKAWSRVIHTYDHIP